MSKNKKFVVLRGIHENNIFYTMNVKGNDATKLDSGEVVYVVVDYVNTSKEAQEAIRLEYRRVCIALNKNLCDFLMPTTDLFIKDVSYIK